MSNKGKTIYFVVFAVLYLGYTVIIAKHGIHWTNSIITLALLVLSGFYYLKSKQS